MRYRVSGIDGKTRQSVDIEVDADSQKAAFEIAKREHSIFPKSATSLGGSRWVYKMVQIPPQVAIGEGSSSRGVAAKYLESVVNEYSELGWEFQRVDAIGVQVNPGCLGGLFGAQTQQFNYYVITFRQWVEV